MRSLRLLMFLLFGAVPAVAQTVQLGYDLRHTIDARNNARNYATGSFEFFKALDYGSLLVKMEADFNGRDHNLGKLYAQISHSLTFWRFPVLLHLEYAGGLGFVGETSTGYPINNAYSIGAAHPFRLMNSWGSTFLAYRYTNFDRPSHDVMYSFWWAKDVHERVSVTAYVVLWTINRNHGDAWTQHLGGKALVGIAEPQLWYRLNEVVAVGSEIKLYYHVYAYSDRLLVYPSISLKYDL